MVEPEVQKLKDKKKAKKAWDTIRDDASKLAYKNARKKAKREVSNLMYSNFNFDKLKRSRLQFLGYKIENCIKGIECPCYIWHASSKFDKSFRFLRFFKCGKM